MSLDDSSLDELYTEESDLNFEGILYREAAEGWNPSTDIDWSVDLDLDEDERNALADGATQFHYSNISHLMLCGRLLEHGSDMELKKLALFLAFSKMRNVDTWGRYLGKLSATTEVQPQTKEFFQRMTEEDDLPNLLLGMGVLGGTVGYGVLEGFGDMGDPILKQIAESIVEQKRKNEELLVNYLRPLIASMDEERLEEMKELARFYREQSERIVHAHSDSYQALGSEAGEVAENVLNVTDEFYRKIGLDPEEL